MALITDTIAMLDPADMLVDKQHLPVARTKLSANVTIWNVATDDLWCRDSGPVFLWSIRMVARQG